MYKIGPFQYAFKTNSVVKFPQKTIFCKEEISILKGELVVITGPSGSGKSTLLRVLKGIIPEFSNGVFEGTVLYKNNKLHGEQFKNNLQEIVFLFQNPFSQLIYPKACEEFFFSMENFQFSREAMDQKRKELETFFNLDQFWHKKTNELSHGECQRLVLASLLAVDPEVLLLDEPTAFLDPAGRQFFYHWLSKHKGKRTIVIVDHHLDEVLPLADKIISLDKVGEVKMGRSDSALVPQSFSLAPVDDRLKENITLKVSNISFKFKGQQKLLDNINFMAQSGDVIAVEGENGRGKSTLFKLIAGVLKLSNGKVAIEKNNKPLHLKQHCGEMGFIFQNPESHFFYDTIREELKTNAGPNFEKTLINFFSNIDLSRSPFLLSEGEKRRLSLLMTIFQKKTILFYDEPTFGQDQESISMITNLILQFRNMGKIQLIISHDRKFIKELNAIRYKLENHQLVKYD